MKNALKFCRGKVELLKCDVKVDVKARYSGTSSGSIVFAVCHRYYPGKMETGSWLYIELFGRMLLTCYLRLRECPENVPIRVQWED